MSRLKTMKRLFTDFASPFWLAIYIGTSNIMGIVYANSGATVLGSATIFGGIVLFIILVTFIIAKGD